MGEYDFEECGCDVVPCQYTIFRSSVTATPIPRLELEYKLAAWKSPQYTNKFKRYMNYTVEDLAENMAMIEVYFGSSSITNVEEVIAYDFDNLLGDIGGVMGLFLGASMFTTMEFCTLLVNLISRLWDWKMDPERRRHSPIRSPI